MHSVWPWSNVWISIGVHPSHMAKVWQTSRSQGLYNILFKWQILQNVCVVPVLSSKTRSDRLFSSLRVQVSALYSSIDWTNVQAFVSLLMSCAFQILSRFRVRYPCHKSHHSKWCHPGTQLLHLLYFIIANLGMHLYLRGVSPDNLYFCLALLIVSCHIILSDRIFYLLL